MYIYIIYIIYTLYTSMIFFIYIYNMHNAYKKRHIKKWYIKKRDLFLKELYILIYIYQDIYFLKRRVIIRFLRVIISKTALSR